MTDKVAHYGVKGMKWGVRKSGSDASSLSNEQLKTRINRMNLEKNYNRLTQEKSGQSIISKGASAASEIIGNAAKQTLTNALSKQMTGVLDNVLENK